MVESIHEIQQINFCSFANIGQSLAVATDTGIRVFRIGPEGKFKLEFERKIEGGVRIVQNISEYQVAFVGTGQNWDYPVHKIVFWD